MSYIGVPPFGQTVRSLSSYTATAGQTTFYPSGGYTVTYLDVYLNGLRMVNGVDYTASDGLSVVFSSGLVVDDVVEIAVYGTISFADSLRRSGDTINGTLNTQHLLPSANVTYDLGSPTMRYRDLYLANSTIYIGNTTVSETGGSLQISNSGQPAVNLATITQASNLAANAYSNAVSTAATDASTKAATAYSNAVSTAATDATTKAATAYSNAVSTAATDASTKAATAYSNAVAYAASNSYVNTTFAPKASPTFTGTASFADVTISGNLTASGTTTYINTTQLNIGDNLITLNADIGAVAPTENAGIEVKRGTSANVALRWNETSDVWETTVDGTTYLTIATNNNVTTAYSNAVAYAAANSYVNTQLGLKANLSGATFSGAVSGITTLAAGNTTITGFANVTGSIQVGGTSSFAGLITGTITSANNADYLDGQHGSYYTTAGNLTGTIPSAVLGNSTLYIGTTAVALNRASSNLGLNGISGIDFNASASRGIRFDYGSVCETYSTQGTIIGNNIYVDPTDTVGNQIRYKNSHPSYGHTTIEMAAGIHSFYGASASVTSGTVVSRVLKGTWAADGSLTVNTSVKSPLFYDSNNTSYYVDPASTSSLNSATFGGAVSGITTLAAGNTTITGFANVSSTLQVGGTSTLSGVSLSGVIDSSGDAGGYRFAGRSFAWNSAMQTPTTMVPHIMQNTYSGWDPIMGIKTTNGFWQFGAYSSDILHLGYMAGAFGGHATNSFDQSLQFYSAGYILASNSFRAPIFYDSDNTNYYVDAAGNSTLNTMNLTGSSGQIFTVTSTANTGSNYIMFSSSAGSGNKGFVGYGSVGADNMHLYNYKSASLSLGTASVDRLIIDASGRVTRPYQPIFQTSSTGYGAVTSTKIIHTVGTIVNVGSHYNTSNGRFTAPVAGTYVFWLCVTPSSTASSPAVWFRVNGTTAQYGITLAYNAGYNACTSQAAIPLNAGDYVEGIIEEWNGTTLTIWNASMGGYLL